MRIAAAQLDIAWEDKSRNLKMVEQAAILAAKHACELLVLPEMCLTGFSMNTAVTAEPSGGKSEHSLKEIAKRHRLHLITGLVEARGSECANIAAVIDPEGKIIAKYAKTHLFPLAGEERHHVSGKETVVFKINDVPASVAICYDLRFPELLRPIAGEVEVIFVIANWPSSRKEHWVALLRARAIENQCFVVGVNRTGVDAHGLAHSGDSSAFSPEGDTIIPFHAEGESLFFEFDPAIVQPLRKSHPFLP